jgi:hypothetical protein
MLRFPIFALAMAMIAIGRGAASGQFLEVERRRDRIARYCFLIGGVSILFFSILWLFV